MNGRLKHIRLASTEEVDAIRDKADLLPGHTQVLALDAENGSADLAVLRNCFELNPVIYSPTTNDLRRARFLYSLEERLLGMGVDRYYFQLDSSATDYLAVVKEWGAEQVSPQPEIRFLKVIK